MAHNKGFSSKSMVWGRIFKEADKHSKIVGKFEAEWVSGCIALISFSKGSQKVTKRIKKTLFYISYNNTSMS